MSDLRDPSGYAVKLSAVPATVIAPSIAKLSTTANLAPGAFIEFEFTMDQSPIADMMVSADQNLTIATFVRIDQTDTYRQIDNNIPYNAGVTYDRMLDGKRFPGTLWKVRITNTSAIATTRLNAEVQVRSS